MGIISNGAAAGSMQAGKNSKKLLQAAQSDAASTREFERRMLEQSAFQSLALADIRDSLRRIAEKLDS